MISIIVYYWKLKEESSVWHPMEKNKNPFTLIWDESFNFPSSINPDDLRYRMETTGIFSGYGYNSGKDINNIIFGNGSTYEV